MLPNTCCYRELARRPVVESNASVIAHCERGIPLPSAMGPIACLLPVGDQIMARACTMSDVGVKPERQCGHDIPLHCGRCLARLRSTGLARACNILSHNTAKHAVRRMRTERATPAFNESICQRYTTMRTPAVNATQYYQLGSCKLCRPRAPARASNARSKYRKCWLCSTRSKLG